MNGIFSTLSMTLALKGKMRSTPWPEADLADGEAALRAALERDHDALESLEAFFVAFFNLDLDANSVAGHEIGVVGAVELVGEPLHYGMNRHGEFLTVPSEEIQA